MYVCMYACMHEFPDDNKQEILEPKLINMFCYCTFKWITFVVEVLESTNKILQEYFLDIPVFKLVAILKSINKIFEKQLQRNPLLR